MSGETIIGPSKTLRLLHRDDDDGTLAAAGEVTTGLVRVVGLARARGLLQADTAPAAGYPRIRQSIDGENFGIVQPIPRDYSQAGYAYSFDVAIQGNYLIVEWTHGGSQATYLRASVEAVAGIFGAPNVMAGATSGVRQFVASDKDSHFTGAIADGAHEFENITGLPSNVGQIEGIWLLAEEQLDWTVHFWSSDGADDADLDSDSWLGSVDLAGADAKRIVGASEGTWRYVAMLSEPLAYFDADGTNELHVSLQPNGAAKTAGATGEVRLRIAFRTE